MKRTALLSVFVCLAGLTLACGGGDEVEPEVILMPVPSVDNTPTTTTTTTTTTEKAEDPKNACADDKGVEGTATGEKAEGDKPAPKTIEQRRAEMEARSGSGRTTTKTTTTSGGKKTTGSSSKSTGSTSGSSSKKTTSSGSTKKK